MKNKTYAIFGVLFLLLSLGGAIYLSFQNADTRNQAVGNGACACKKESETVIGTCNPDGSCSCPSGYGLGTNKCAVSNDIPSQDDKCKAGQTSCQENKDGKNTGYLCSCLTELDPNDWQCTTQDLNKCPTDSGNVDPNFFACDSGGNVSISGRCLVAKSGTKISVAYKYKCADKFGMGNGCQQNETVLRDVGSACFDGNFCGTQQIDLPDQKSCFISVEDHNCDSKPTDKPTATPTKKVTPTNTSTPTPTGRISSPTPTPTFVITTDTPTPTPTGVTNTPTPTPTSPVVTNTPTLTPTPPPISYLGCGYTPCDSTGKICNSGLVCITANNSNQYCSQPGLTEACKINPGYAGCCTVPVVEGPSPTRIVLPVSGVNFPVQALTIIGGITTLLGFLILL